MDGWIVPAWRRFRNPRAKSITIWWLPANCHCLWKPHITFWIVLPATPDHALNSFVEKIIGGSRILSYSTRSANDLEIRHGNNGHVNWPAATREPSTRLVANW